MEAFSRPRFIFGTLCAKKSNLLFCDNMFIDFVNYVLYFY